MQAAFGVPKSLYASVVRSERASYRNRCDLVVLDLPGGAIGDLVHEPQGARRGRQAKLAAVLRERGHLAELLDDEATRCGVGAASNNLPKLVAWWHTHCQHVYMFQTFLVGVLGGIATWLIY